MTPDVYYADLQNKKVDPFTPGGPECVLDYPTLEYTRKAALLYAGVGAVETRQSDRHDPLTYAKGNTVEAALRILVGADIEFRVAQKVVKASPDLDKSGCKIDVKYVGPRVGLGVYTKSLLDELDWYFIAARTTPDVGSLFTTESLLAGEKYPEGTTLVVQFDNVYYRGKTLREKNYIPYGYIRGDSERYSDGGYPWFADGFTRDLLDCVRGSNVD